MDLIINSLKSVSIAIIEPMHLLMLFIFGIIFYFKNIRIVSIQKMTLGEGVNTPLELTLSQIVFGILAGAVGTVILTVLGVSFNETSGIEFIFMISILCLFYKKKYISYAYSAAILGMIGIILKVASNITGIRLLMDINVVSLITLVGVPADSIYLNASSWWPILNKSQTLSLIASAMVATIPIYGILGYGNVTFTQEKNKKSLRSGTVILIYGISIVLIAQLATLNILGQIISIIYLPLVYEFIMRYEANVEKKGQYLYVSDDEGIMILEVTPNSPAYEVGVKRGDKIIEVNGEKIKSEVDIFNAIKESIFKISIKIKNNSGQVLEYNIQPRNKILGVLLVPKMVKREDMIEINQEDLKDIINEIKNKK